MIKKTAHRGSTLTKASVAKCLAFYGARCFDNNAYLYAGFCATFDTSTESDSDILSLGECPSYYGFIFTKQGRYWFIQLPDNVSELNDYMCGPLNRKGRLCSECKDGYGLGTTSVGFQHFECTECLVWGTTVSVSGNIPTHCALSRNSHLPN